MTRRGDPSIPLDRLVVEAPGEVDLTNARHLAMLAEGAEALQSECESAADAEAFDLKMAQDAELPVFARVAMKLALSRLRLREVEEPVHVSVVFAVYKEHQRLRPADEHPLGEDALREKLRQLRWLFRDTPQHTWDLTVVDDGCPEGSGELARTILDDEVASGEEARVLWLERAIDQRHPMTRGISATRESQKGGSIRFGLWEAAHRKRDAQHIVLFTDADLSTHLGQIGLLVSPIVSGNAAAAVGSRREASSVVVKAGGRNHRGKLFIYLWKRLLPELRGITDTQCGFKAFDADHLRRWIDRTDDPTFSFDIELLLRVRQTDGGIVAAVPVAWIDSEAASTTAEHAPYLPMLKRVVRLRGAGSSAPEEAADFARLIERLDASSFERLLEAVPEAITSREPLEFDDFADVSAEVLAAAAVSASAR